ncbi:MAG: N-acetyltransferase [Candidatus Verstraetearchaeota archaeon]|nr:N-acetyltransferase [Candidatus Verstraetearchaeota archaeon]
MEVKVKDNAIVIKLDERASANIMFHIEGNRMYLDSTYTPEEYRGRGVGGELVKASMKYAREHGLLIVPVCTFAVEYFKRHPEYGNMLYKG